MFATVIFSGLLCAASCAVAFGARGAVGGLVLDLCLLTAVFSGLIFFCGIDACDSQAGARAEEAGDI